MTGTAILYSGILFLTVMASGIVAYGVVAARSNAFRFVLRFGGAYLFGITVIHLLPEVFEIDPFKAGTFILVGFFLQLILDYFSSGIEHGHIHRDGLHSSGYRVPYALILSLFVHAFLEGTVLANPHPHSNMLLSGIIVHKIPVAFTLVAVMRVRSSGKRLIGVFLLLLAVGSPLGLFTGGLLQNAKIFGQHLFGILTAVVAGSFLHVSTTIFFEAGPEHRFDAGKLLISLTGATAAIMTQLFF